jgi:photosystem II stability/assembly factor-like uncharacterized protein
MSTSIRVPDLYVTSITVKAIAVKEGMTDSYLTTATYTIKYPIEYAAGQYGGATLADVQSGIAGAARTSQGIELIFPEPVNLTADDVIITNDTGAVVRTGFEGSGTTWKIPCSIVRAGRVLVVINKINKPGIYSFAKGVTVIVVERPETLWTKWNNNNNLTNLKSVAYGDGTFVAVGENGRIVRSTDDGATWTAVANNGFGSIDFNAVAYANGTFVAVGDVGAIRISTNAGVTWVSGENTAVLVPEYTETVPGYWDTMTYGYPVWVPAREVTRPAHWETTPGSPFGALSVRGVIGQNGGFVAVGENFRTAKLVTGAVWEEVNTTGGTVTLNAVARDRNGSIVIAGNSGKAAVYANDQWTNTDIPFGSSNINALVCTSDGNRFVAAGDNGKIAYANTPLTWNAVGSSPFGSSSIRGLAYGGDKYFAVGDGGKMAWSRDGSTWTDNPLLSAKGNGLVPLTAGRLNGIVYGNGRWVAVGDGGVILRSQ